MDFIETSSSEDTITRLTTCVRAFKKMQGLFDSLLLVEQIGDRRQLTTHLSLSAIEQDQIEALNQKFLEQSL